MSTLSDRINSAASKVESGKEKIAAAITAKGVSTSSSATFNTMANNIGRIDTEGEKWVTVIGLADTVYEGADSCSYPFSINIKEGQTVSMSDIGGYTNSGSGGRNYRHDSAGGFHGIKFYSLDCMGLADDFHDSASRLDIRVYSTQGGYVSSSSGNVQCSGTAKVYVNNATGYISRSFSNSSDIGSGPIIELTVRSISSSSTYSLTGASTTYSGWTTTLPNDSTVVESEERERVDLFDYLINYRRLAA